MRIFCTLFDGGYAVQGMALIDSLNTHCDACLIYILCLDADAELLLSHADKQNIVLIRLHELEEFDRQLSDVKRKRKLIEYYFTCKASLLRYILNINPDCERVVYLDADLFFFSSPSAIDAEIAAGSVAVIEHKFSSKNKHLLKYGRFNAGWLSVRNDATGRRCVEWWRARCLEWCHDYTEGDRYADQKYLDKFPEKFNATIVNHLGANLAPWNMGNYIFSRYDEKILVNNQPVIFCHFHGLKRLAGPFFESGLAKFRQQLSTVARNALFIPYLKKCCEAEYRIRDIRQVLLGQHRIHVDSVSLKIRRGTFVKRAVLVLVNVLRNLRYKTFIIITNSNLRRCN